MVRPLQVVRYLPVIHSIFKAHITNRLQSLAPKYEELGRLFTPHSSQVTIAKVDATANDVPEEIAGFPTIKLYPGNSKSAPVDYSGSRTVEDLVAFIRDNGSHKIDAYGSGSADVDMEDAASVTVVPGATEEMQHQAPAATPNVVSRVAEGAQKVVEAVVGGDDNVDEHDEL